MTPSDSLRERAYLLIRDRILTYTYRPGDSLSESRVATELDMSRTPVRAALEGLEADGLVQRHSGTGFFVAHITPQTISDVFFVRVALECHAARNLIDEQQPARWEKFAALFEAFPKMVHPPTGDDWLLVQEADRLFHREIVAQTRNEVALEITDRVELRVARFRAVAWAKSERYLVGARDHLAIVKAIQNRDSAEATELLEQHLINGRNHLISLMSKPQGEVILPPLAPGAGRVARWLDDQSKSPKTATELLAKISPDSPVRTKSVPPREPMLEGKRR